MAIGGGLPMPKVYIINDPSPNAFATGTSPNKAAITATTGLLAIMNREELEGVIGHEMSHIRNYDVRLVLIVATSIALDRACSRACCGVRCSSLRQQRDRDYRIIVPSHRGGACSRWSR